MSIETKFKHSRDVTPTSKRRANRELLKLMATGQEKSPPGVKREEFPGVRKIKPGRPYDVPGIVEGTPRDPMTRKTSPEGELTVDEANAIAVRDIKKHQPRSKGTFDAIRGDGIGSGETPEEAAARRADPVQRRQKAEYAEWQMRMAARDAAKKLGLDKVINASGHEVKTPDGPFMVHRDRQKAALALAKEMPRTDPMRKFALELAKLSGQEKRKWDPRRNDPKNPGMMHPEVYARYHAADLAKNGGKKFDTIRGGKGGKDQPRVPSGQHGGGRWTNK